MTNKIFAWSFARLALAIIYVWFGALKVIGVSPASALVARLYECTLPLLPFSTFIIIFGMVEVLIGLLFLFRGAEKLALVLLALHLVLTTLPLFLLSSETWGGFLVPTLEGQYIIKNILIVAAALTVAREIQPAKRLV